MCPSVGNPSPVALATPRFPGQVIRFLWPPPAARYSLPRRSEPPGGYAVLERSQLARRDVLKVLAGATASALCAACSAPAPGVPTPSAAVKGGVAGRGSVVLANFTEATGLNPFLSTEGASQIIWELMFEGLV